MTNKQEQWEKSLNIDKRFGYLSQEARDHILAEIIFQRKQSRQEAIEEVLAIIDEAKKDVFPYDNGEPIISLQNKIKSLSKENL